MRKISMILAAIASLGASVGNASASLMAIPPISAAQPVLAVADVEMTVSNKYGYAHLRQQPSKNSKLLATLPEGTKVAVIGKVANGTWVHVKAGDNEGYIQANLLK